MSHYQKIKSKIIDYSQLDNLIADWKSNNETIVFTNGCFDILHRGHATYLQKAKELGCKVFVMEVSSHGIHQKRVEGLKFFLKIFTNISQDHLDYHKTIIEYKEAKYGLFRLLFKSVKKNKNSCCLISISLYLSNNSVKSLVAVAFDTELSF